MYKTQDLEEKAIKAITEKKLFFFTDVAANLPCSKETFYQHFPVNSDQYKRVAEALERVKTEIKVSMRSKWYKSDHAALQINLYKLIATKEELQAISMQHIDVDIPENTEIKISIKKSSE
jgi:hypothetical protein